MQMATPNRLKELRLQRGLQLEDVAVHVRRSAAMISRYERGESKPDIDVALKLAAFFGVSVEYLMGEPEGAAA
jgi:transcriptional regulator with XRE-family HTH domain